MTILKRKRIVIIWLLVSIASIAILRLPNYQRELINWDEHTFMLSGADLLDGNLPYIETLDNKPPFLYANVALAFVLFGRSVSGFRIFGDLCILINAIFIFLISRRLFNEMTAAFGSLSFIALMSAPFAAHTSSEIIALVYLMAGLWLLFNFKLNSWVSLFAGILMSLAILVRTNLILLAACGALVFFMSFIKTKSLKDVLNFVFYAIGGVIPLFILTMIYWVNGKLEYLKLGLITIPFEYSEARRSIIGSILRIGYKWLEFILMKPLIVVPVTVLLIISIYLLIKQSTRFLKNQTRWSNDLQQNTTIMDLLILLLYLSTYVSILYSGKTYAHYQIQLFPFISILIGRAFFSISNRKIKSVLVALLLISVVTGLPEMITSLNHDRDPGKNFEGMKLANSIRPLIREEDTIWALNQHIVLFYLDKNPIIPLVTHPSNLTQPSYVEGMKSFDPTAKDPFVQVLQLNPQFIITSNTIEVDYLSPDQNQMLIQYIKENYGLVYETEQSAVYKRVVD